jgi:hypothetical protein
MTNSLQVPAAHAPHSWITLTVTVLGLAGILALFLPFTENRTPFMVALGSEGGDLIFLALPLFLACLASAASVRWCVSNRLSRVERLLGYIGTLTGAIMFLSLDIRGGMWPSRFFEWLVWTGLLMIPLAGVLLWVRNRRKGIPKALNAITAMQIVYIADAVWALALVFLPSAPPKPGEFQLSLKPQIGAYFVLLTALVYLTQICAVSFARVAPMPETF